MKGKMKKIIIALLCTGIILGTQEGITCYAATGGISVTITKARISGVYTYGKKGHNLKIIIYGYERIPGTDKKNIVTASGVLSGDYTSVSASRNADTGYEFYEMSAYGYVDGALDAAKTNMTP